MHRKHLFYSNKIYRKKHQKDLIRTILQGDIEHWARIHQPLLSHPWASLRTAVVEVWVFWIRCSSPFQGITLCMSQVSPIFHSESTVNS